MPSLDEALRDRLVEIVQNTLSSPSTGMNQYWNTVDPKGRYCPIQIPSSCVMLGDSLEVPESRISVCGGGADNATDQEFTPFMSQRLMKNTYYTEITLYIHPDEFGSVDVYSRADMFERCKSRFSDYMRRYVFNTQQYSVIGTNSDEYTQTPDGSGYKDAFHDCHVEVVRKGVVPKMFDSLVMVESCTLIHKCYIA